jgi:hypothetical protein
MKAPSIEVSRGRPKGSARPTSRDRYALVLSVVLLVVLAAGFTRSFYLRPLFDRPALPAPLVVHGVVLSLWFLWLFNQTALVAIGRTDVHRRTGWVGAGLAVAVVVTGVVVILGVVPGVIARGGSLQDSMPLFAGVVWGNGGMLMAFVVFVAAALALRRHPAAHKRLMLLASINLVPPAAHRIGLLPSLQVLGTPEANALAFVLAALLALSLSLVVHDVVSRGRVHPVTAWGIPGYLAWFLASIFVIPGTALGEMTAEWLVRIAT